MKTTVLSECLMHSTSWSVMKIQCSSITTPHENCNINYISWFEKYNASYRAFF